MFSVFESLICFLTGIAKRCQERLLYQPSWQWKLEKNKIKKYYPSMDDSIQAELNSLIGYFRFYCFSQLGWSLSMEKIGCEERIEKVKREGCAEKKYQTVFWLNYWEGCDQDGTSTALRWGIKKWLEWTSVSCWVLSLT